MPPVFDENRIVLTFAALSDLHNSPNVPLALRYLQRVARLDAIVHCGDMTDGVVYYNNLGEVEKVRRVYEAETPESLRWFFCLGNHDSNGGSRATLFYDNLGERFYRGDVTDGDFARRTACRHAVIGGLHFIALESHHAPTRYSDEILAWLSGVLAEAAADTPGRPIFLLTHAPVKDTVYGSVCDGCDQLTTLLSQYPQAVIFTGHSHWSLYHDGSIRQGGFTAVNLGSVSYMTCQPNRYMEQLSPFHLLYNSYDTSLGAIVEVDAAGAVRITRHNFMLGCPIRKPWIIPAPTVDGAHLTAYPANYGVGEPAPVFLEGEVSAELTYESTVTVCHPAARSAGMVFSYRYDIVKDDEVVHTFDSLSEFWNHPTDGDMPPVRRTVLQDISVSPPYTVRITALDDWDNESVPLEAEVLPAAFADIATAAALSAHFAAATPDTVQPLWEAFCALPYRCRALVDRAPLDKALAALDGSTVYEETKLYAPRTVRTDEGVTATAADNGLHIAFERAPQGSMAVLGGVYNADGLHLRLRVRGEGMLTLLLDSDREAPAFDMGSTNLHLDFATGCVTAQPWPPVRTLHTALLPRAAQTGAPIDLYITHEPSDGYYRLRIVTDEGKADGTVVSSAFKYAACVSDAQHVHVALAAGGESSTDLQVQVLSLHGGEAPHVYDARFDVR